MVRIVFLFLVSLKPKNKQQNNTKLILDPKQIFRIRNVKTGIGRKIYTQRKERGSEIHRISNLQKNSRHPQCDLTSSVNRIFSSKLGSIVRNQSISWLTRIRRQQRKFWQLNFIFSRNFKDVGEGHFNSKIYIFSWHSSISSTRTCRQELTSSLLRCQPEVLPVQDSYQNLTYYYDHS